MLARSVNSRQIATMANHNEETYRRASNLSPDTSQSVSLLTSPVVSPTLLSESHADAEMTVA